MLSMRQGQHLASQQPMKHEHSQIRHFLTLQDFHKDELYEMLALSFIHKYARDSFTHYVPAHLQHASLKHKIIALIFEKPSTRTRVSFEAGIYKLGGQAITLMGKDTQIGRGELVKDTARVLSGMVDMIMVRTFFQASLEEFAHFSAVPVINGLTDTYHPTQVLADMLTIIECGFYDDKFASYYKSFISAHPNAPALPPRIATPTIAFIGDGNNMANSWINCAAILGLSLRIATPKGYEVESSVLSYAKEAASMSQAHITYTHSPIQAATNAHIIITDTWISMGQEQEKQSKHHDFVGFCVDSALMKHADAKAIFLHCLPAYRGYEVSEEVLESAQSKVWLEAHNRLYIQQGIMLWLMAQTK